MNHRQYINESSSIDDDDEDNGGHGEGVDEAPVNVVELRPEDKKDSDKRLENI
jgi:hypothetical protein